MVADTLKISVEQVQEIGVIEFLNWWAYNKEKQDDLRIKMNGTGNWHNETKGGR